MGVTLYREGDPISADPPFTQENLKSYCQALALAGKGRTLLLAKEQMGCKLLRKESRQTFSSAFFFAICTTMIVSSNLGHDNLKCGRIGGLTSSARPYLPVFFLPSPGLRGLFGLRTCSATGTNSFRICSPRSSSIIATRI